MTKTLLYVTIYYQIGITARVVRINTLFDSFMRLHTILRALFCKLITSVQCRFERLSAAFDWTFIKQTNFGVVHFTSTYDWKRGRRMTIIYHRL